MHLDAAFLLPRLRIAPNTLENEVREQADGGGVDDLQPLHPLWHLVGGAVRQKSVLVGQVQDHVDLSEDSLIPPRVRIRESGAPWQVHDAQMLKLGHSIMVAEVISRRESKREMTE